MSIKRTTLCLDEDIFKAVKKAAIDHNKNFQEFITGILIQHLNLDNKKEDVVFKDYHMGEIKGKLTRKEIYSDI